MSADSSSRSLDLVSTELVHKRIDGIHVSGVDLVMRVTLRKALGHLVHGGLVVADRRGNSIDGLLTNNGSGVRGGNGDELRKSVQDNELLWGIC